MKASVLAASIFLLASALAAVACSGADSATLKRPGTNEETSGTEPTGNEEENQPEPSEPADAGTTPDEDSGTSPGVDSGAPVNAFTGAPAYTSKAGPTTRKTQHPFTNDDPAGRPCFNCHGAGATEFAFAGTVYKDAAGTQRAANVEVRVRDGAGKAISAYTNADGNFFFKLNPNGDLALPGHAGIRTATGQKLMKGGLADGNCNGCHKTAGAGRLVAP